MHSLRSSFLTNFIDTIFKESRGHIRAFLLIREAASLLDGDLGALGVVQVERVDGRFPELAPDCLGGGISLE